MDAKVLIIGAGGLGSPAALYLAAAGTGTIGIADADVVDLSNLQRQVIHLVRVAQAVAKKFPLKEKVILAPLMIVAGAHARNDLAGDGEDYWETRFTQEGYQVGKYLEETRKSQ